MSKATRDHVWGALPVAPVDAAHPLDLSGFDPAVREQITARLVSPHFDAWSHAAARVGYCARPIRLRGHSTTVGTRTGEVLSSFSTTDEPPKSRASARTIAVPPSLRGVLEA